MTFSVALQWIPELRHYAPSVPIILVGTKLGVNLCLTEIYVTDLNRLRMLCIF